MTVSDNSSERPKSSQWKTLDAGPRSRRGLGESTIMSMMRSAPQGLFSPLLAGTVGLVVLGVTLYVGYLVRASMRNAIRDSLRTVLAANAAAVELWMREQQAAVVLNANLPVFRDLCESVLETADQQTQEWENVSPPPLRAQTERLRGAGYLGWAILDPFGNVMESSDTRLKHARLPLSTMITQRLDSGATAILKPVELNLPTGPIPVMGTLAPLAKELGMSGSFALLIDPANQFSEILTVARMGETGETYAFDQTGLLLSRSRFEGQLVSIGLLTSGQPSPLQIQVRDPGQSLLTSPISQPNASNWPMTQMADKATRGGAGYDVNGYRDYRGVYVVGAWRWFPEYGFGMASEWDVDEAFQSMNILRNSFLTLVAAVVLAGVVLFALAWATRPKTKRNDRIEDLQRRLGQYDLQQRIGRGGMGTVYLGAHGLLDRKVAIKVLENADATDRSLARFQREVQLTASLQHPNTIEIFDFGRTEEGTFFYVMEFVDGISLEQLVDYYGRQPAERVIYLLLQICGSIAEAHQAGMVHRDIKPANVLLTSRSGIHDLIKVLDFGLAKQIDHDSLQLTRVDSLTGTPLYMSPESIRDATTAGVLSDIYSIGAVGYTLLTGLPTFEADTPADVCAIKLHQEPEVPELRVGVPLAKDLQTILMRCLRLDPKERPSTVAELANALLRCRESPSWTQKDAELWWKRVFDGPYLDDFELDDDAADEGTCHDTAVNEKRPAANLSDNPLSGSTAS